MITPKYLHSLQLDATEKMVKDVEQQILALNKSGHVEGRIYMEGNANFGEIKDRFEKLGFTMSAPSSDDEYHIENISYWCSWEQK